MFLFKTGGPTNWIKICNYLFRKFRSGGVQKLASCRGKTEAYQGSGRPTPAKTGDKVTQFLFLTCRLEKKRRGKGLKKIDPATTNFRVSADR